MTRKRWRKSWEEKWRDEASDLLDLTARALRALLGDVAELEDGSDVGWAVDGRGLAYDRPRLARLLAATAEQVDGAVGQLVRAGVAVEVDGRIGLVGWRETQEDPSAKRVRQHRERAAERENGRYSNAGCNADGSAEETPRGQRTEDRGDHVGGAGEGGREASTAPDVGRELRLARERGPVPLTVAGAAKRAGLDAGDLARFERGEALPVAAELGALARVYCQPELAHLALPAQEPGVVAEVAGLWHSLRVDLGILPPDAPPPVIDGALTRLVFAPAAAEGQALLERWRTVLRRAAEEVRRGKGRDRSAEFFTLSWLSRPASRARYLDCPDLDRRLDEVRERAPPGRRARERGPAPPQNDDLPPVC